jgi:hypothetical protein
MDENAAEASPPREAPFPNSPPDIARGRAVVLK